MTIKFIASTSGLLAIVVLISTVLSIALVELYYCKKRGIGFRRRIRYWVQDNITDTKWFYPIKTYKVKRKLKKEENFIPRDEFHHSLNLDASLMMKLNKKDKAKYIEQLTRRRQEAHDQDIFLSDLDRISD
jgi:hypothetical protein